MTDCRRWLLAACMSLVVGMSHAGDALTAGTIDRWMSAMQELVVWAEAQGLDQEDFTSEADDDATPDFSVVLERLGEHRAGMERIVSDHAFDNAEQWAEVSNRITNAYMALIFEENSDEIAAAQQEMQAEMRRQMQQLEKNPDLSEGQKAAYRDQMEAAMQMYDAQAGGSIFGFEATDADIAAVRQRRSALDRFFEFDDDRD